MFATAGASSISYDILCWNFVNEELVPRPLYAFIPFEYQDNVDCSFPTCDGKGGVIYISYFERPVVMRYEPLRDEIFYFFMPLTPREESVGTPYYHWPLKFPPSPCRPVNWKLDLDTFNWPSMLLFPSNFRYQYLDREQ
jgi:hypothetical protein